MSDVPTRSQSIRVIIHIKRVWLAVRFYCKLSFIIRNQLSQKIAETDNTFNLFRGECLVNQNVYFELPQEFLLSRAKKLKMVVMMISANGMVPAGFINFTTYPKSPYQQFEAIVPLERCEDARAQIKFMHMYQNCSKTPIQNSYINHLFNKQDRIIENGGYASKLFPASSNSLNKQSSLRKMRNKQVQSRVRAPQAIFSKPLISPRLLPRNSEQATNEKSININSFKKYWDDRIAEEKQMNDSSINPISKEQLMKEHQQYWLQIVRMEEEIEVNKEEFKRLKQENSALKSQSVSLKEYYEGHEQKIHAFVGQIQENSVTIKRLQNQLRQCKSVIVQKDELQKEFQKVMDIQSNQYRQNLNKIADLQKQVHSAIEQKKAISIKFEMMQQKIIFLQGEAKEYADQNLLLKQKIREQEDRLYFLNKNNESQKKMIDQFEKQIQTLKEQTIKIPALQQANSILNIQIQAVMLQSSLKQEQAVLAREKHAKSLQQLQQLKKTYESLSNLLYIEQSKNKIFQKQLQTYSKEKDDCLFQLRRKQQELNDVKNQIQTINDQNKNLSIKLIKFQASIIGKTTTIQQLRTKLTETIKEKQEIFQKNQKTEKQFQQMGSLISNQIEEKNKIRIQFITLQENYKSIEEQRTIILIMKDQILNQNAELKNEVQKFKKQLQQSQQQLGYLIQKTSLIQMELQNSLSKLQQQSNTRNIHHDQYQESYNQSMTALTLKNGKLQRQLEEVSKNLQKQKSQNKILAQKLATKEAEITQVKNFTHHKLQEILKLMKQNGQLRSLSSNKQIELGKLIKFNEQLTKNNKENLVKIDQLTNQLQFVNEILHRQRQQNSDIEKEFEKIEKVDLPQIQKVGNLKEDSFDEYRHDDVNLQIESRCAGHDESHKNQEGHKGENHKKKKKK